MPSCLALQVYTLLISSICGPDGPTVSQKGLPHERTLPPSKVRLSSGAPASWSMTGAWCCPHDPFRHLACPSPVNLREAETGDSVASLTACAGNSGICGTAAELPSQFRDRPHHAGLGRPGTSPPTPARIEGQKAALPATLPQSHRHATKQRDSTKAGPQARPCPRHFIAAAWELPIRHAYRCTLDAHSVTLKS
jgi:hypothetical protein